MVQFESTCRMNYIMVLVLLEASQFHTIFYTKTPFCHHTILSLKFVSSIPIRRVHPCSNINKNIEHNTSSLYINAAIGKNTFLSTLLSSETDIVKTVNSLMCSFLKINMNRGIFTHLQFTRGKQ